MQTYSFFCKQEKSMVDQGNIDCQDQGTSRLDIDITFLV